MSRSSSSSGDLTLYVVFEHEGATYRVHPRSLVQPSTEAARIPFVHLNLERDHEGVGFAAIFPNVRTDNIFEQHGTHWSIVASILMGGHTAGLERLVIVLPCGNEHESSFGVSVGTKVDDGPEVPE